MFGLRSLSFGRGFVHRQVRDRLLSVACAEMYLKPDNKWYNELGSVMTIKEVDVANGSFSGTYCSAVGNAEKEYCFQGRFNNEGRTLGWTVVYKNIHRNAYSTASWSGQIQMDPITEKPHILTTWLLTAKTKPENDWASTRVGFDTFTFDMPTEDVILRAKLRYGQNHPQDD